MLAPFPAGAALAALAAAVAAERMAISRVSCARAHGPHHQVAHRSRCQEPCVRAMGMQEDMRARPRSDRVQ